MLEVGMLVNSLYAFGLSSVSPAVERLPVAQAGHLLYKFRPCPAANSISNSARPGHDYCAAEAC